MLKTSSNHKISELNGDATSIILANRTHLESAPASQAEKVFANVWKPETEYYSLSSNNIQTSAKKLLQGWYRHVAFVLPFNGILTQRITEKSFTSWYQDVKGPKSI